MIIILRDKTKKEKRKQVNSRYYKSHREKINRAQKKYRKLHKEEAKEYVKKYRDTISGYLRNIFNGMKCRCGNPKHNRYQRYGGRGIKNLFKSPNELINYVANFLN